MEVVEAVSGASMDVGAAKKKSSVNFHIIKMKPLASMEVCTSLHLKVMGQLPLV